MPAINENLKLLRQAKGVTQAEVAEAITVTRQTISSYESGRTQPDLETIKRLADVYQADLQDVLYGGNQLQLRLKRTKTIILVLTAIMILGTLTHSVLFWALNRYYPPTSGIDVAIAQTRFALRDIAEMTTGICTGIFAIGCIIVLYHTISVIHAISFRKLILFFLVTTVALFGLTIPFGVADKTFDLVDYLLPMWNSLFVLILFFAVVTISKLIKQRRRT